MDITTKEKLEHLKEIIKEKDSLMIAFSGGVDSSLVAKIAYEVLGKKALAVTLTSDTFSKRELESAKIIAKEIGITHEIIESSELGNDEFIKNPENRCYFCKKEEAIVLKKIANEIRIKYIADGVNLSDFDEHRPGIKALDEEGIIHPLVEARIKKSDIKVMAKFLGLSNYNLPSTTCLSSRIPYGEAITIEKLKRIEEAESFILSSGFRQVRVRCHKDVVRIEVEKEEIEKAINFRKEIVRRLKEVGFKYITLDLEGYRSGSMDEVL
ncbi:MAG: ATP-dependent sacrificial sulfur transferase LarE [Candidatus Pacearchaeota archaeon]|nr:ATP-dependent sacrificial sulfur transferase LarE [Candidatus Pacearchaeota archaeon]